MGSDEAIRTAIDRIGRLMHGRSAAFADEFAADAILVGSEPGEVAHGREAIRALIAGFHALPARYTWEWDAIDIRADGGIAWFFAEGRAVREDDAGERTRRPYRLAGVIRVADGRWLLFSGSEPRP